MRVLPRGLAPRLILALTILVAIVEAVFGYINLHSQERLLLDEMIKGADQVSRGIKSATWNSMLVDQADATYQILETIGQEPGIEAVRIFNRAGRVTFSSDPDAPEQVDVTNTVCTVCHGENEPQVNVDMYARSRTFESPEGVRCLALVTPIYNEPACSNADCHAHPADMAVLGVLDVVMSLATVDRDVAAIKVRAFRVAFIQIVLIGILIALLTRQFVGKPIQKLIRATHSVSAMQLDEPIDVDGPRELTELAASFNTMQMRLKDAMAEVHEFTQTLEGKVEERSHQLNVAQQKLIQSDRMASLGQLAASVAHEINNPLSGVLNFSMLMQRLLTEEGVPENRRDDFRKYLSTVIDETTRVGHIVSDLLAFSRRSSPQKAKANLNRIVEHTISIIAHKLVLGGVGLDVSLDRHMPEIPCDASQLQQVIINLVMNAAEAVPEGGQVAVRTQFDKEEDVVLMMVEDTGGGIPEDHQARIFDPFFTTKEASKGVGLGLTVVYGIVESHGGNIELTSEMGKGTIFKVSLPVHPLVEEPKPTAEDMPTPEPQP